MILPTMNGESVDAAGQQALKNEERKVSARPAVVGTLWLETVPQSSSS